MENFQNSRKNIDMPKDLSSSVYLTRLNIHHTVLYYSEPQWKDTLLPSFLTCSSGTTTMTFSGASLPVE